MKVREIHEEEVPVIRVDRTFSIPPAALWDWLTQSDLTSQWIGPWQYVDENEIEIIWNREKGSPAEPARILEVNEGCGYTLQLKGMPEPLLDPPVFLGEELLSCSVQGRLAVRMRSDG